MIKYVAKNLQIYTIDTMVWWLSLPHILSQPSLEQGFKIKSG